MENFIFCVVLVPDLNQLKLWKKKINFNRYFSKLNIFLIKDEKNV